MDITYYAAAADAAGTTSARLDAGELTADDLRARLGVGNERLAAVLAACSLLVDVLPPFAGG